MTHRTAIQRKSRNIRQNYQHINNITYNWVIWKKHLVSLSLSNRVKLPSSQTSQRELMALITPEHGGVYGGEMELTAQPCRPPASPTNSSGNTPLKPRSHRTPFSAVPHLSVVVLDFSSKNVWSPQQPTADTLSVHRECYFQPSSTQTAWSCSHSHIYTNY